MRCVSPISAFKPDVGGGKLVFSERAGYSPLTIGCGQCVTCRLSRSRYWAIRCLHESQMHPFSSFITLTYDDKYLPVDRGLHYVDYQLFMKRVRKFFSHRDDFKNCWRQRIRFFMCGEYGELLARPHFHACLFGAFFDDRKVYKELPSGSTLWTSDALARLWPCGFSSIGDVTFESAAYVARYVMKKRFGDVANEHSHYKYVDDCGEVHYREPEFAHMSLKPGIGATWFKKFHGDVYPRDFVVVGGLKCKPPKYYDRLLAANDFGVDLDNLEFERYKKSLIGLEDSTPDRLRVLETVTKARLSFKVRTLE